MSMSQALETAVSDFLKTVPDVSGITWPDPIVIVRASVTEIYDYLTPDELEEYLKQITSSSPAVQQMMAMIQQAKSNMNIIIGLLPFLAVPITIPQSLSTLKSLLPPTLELLLALGIDPPEALLPVLQAVNSATAIIQTASAALAPPPLDTLKDILGIP